MNKILGIYQFVLRNALNERVAIFCYACIIEPLGMLIIIRARVKLINILQALLTRRILQQNARSFTQDQYWVMMGIYYMKGEHGPLFRMLLAVGIMRRTFPCVTQHVLSILISFSTVDDPLLIVDEEMRNGGRFNQTIILVTICLRQKKSHVWGFCHIKI